MKISNILTNINICADNIGWLQEPTPPNQTSIKLYTRSENLTAIVETQIRFEVLNTDELNELLASKISTPMN